MTRQITIILEDVRKTRLMQHADMFEQSKVVYEQVTATVVDDFGLPNADKIVTACKGEAYRPVAIFDGDTTHYRDPNVKSISNGQRWALLDDVLPKKAADKTPKRRGRK